MAIHTVTIFCCYNDQTITNKNRQMKISVKFFASLREQIGKADALIETEDSLSVLEIWKQASESESLPENTLCAINMEYTDPNAMVSDGDEVAFFPPVTGG